MRPTCTQNHCTNCSSIEASFLEIRPSSTPPYAITDPRLDALFQLCHISNPCFYSSNTSTMSQVETELSENNDLVSDSGISNSSLTRATATMNPYASDHLPSEIVTSVPVETCIEENQYDYIDYQQIDNDRLPDTRDSADSFDRRRLENGNHLNSRSMSLPRRRFPLMGVKSRTIHTFGTQSVKQANEISHTNTRGDVNTLDVSSHTCETHHQLVRPVRPLPNIPFSSVQGRNPQGKLEVVHHLPESAVQKSLTHSFQPNIPVTQNLPTEHSNFLFQLLNSIPPPKKETFPNGHLIRQKSLIQTPMPVNEIQSPPLSKTCDKSTSVNISSGCDETQEMKWKIKRRADGTRYVTKCLEGKTQSGYSTPRTARRIMTINRRLSASSMDELIIL